MTKKATWGLAVALALVAGIAAIRTLGPTPASDDTPNTVVEDSGHRRPSATARPTRVERVATEVSPPSVLIAQPPEAQPPRAPAAEGGAAGPTLLTASAVEQVVANELRGLQLDSEVLVNVSCPVPPRCIAELSGPQFKSNIARELAEALSDATGTEYQVASTSFSHVQAGSPEPTHATFASFFPAGESRSDANDEVRQAVQAFKADLEARD